MKQNPKYDIGDKVYVVTPGYDKCPHCGEERYLDIGAFEAEIEKIIIKADEIRYKTVGGEQYEAIIEGAVHPTRQEAEAYCLERIRKGQYVED